MHTRFRGANGSRGGGAARRAMLLAGLALASGASLRLAAQEQVLIDVGEEWRYFKGLAAPPADWTASDFDDSAWLAGPTGIGYGDTDDATVLGDMVNSYFSVFCRRRFTVADARAITLLGLSVSYDDGFVAYLNGEEVARSASMTAAGTPVVFNAPAADHEAGVSEAFAVALDALVSGENVLAVEVHNSALASSDLSFVPRLVANPDSCPETLTCAFNSTDGTVTLAWTSPAPSDTIDILRNGSTLEARLDGALVTYVDVSPPRGDVTYRVVGTQAGVPCGGIECAVFVFGVEDIVIDAGEEWRFFRGSSPPPVDWFAEVFDDSAWELGPTGIGYGDGDDATVLDDMQQVAGGQAGYLAVFCRTTFQIANPAPTEDLLLNVTYDDGYVAHVNGAEVGRVNLPPAPAAVNEGTAALAAIANGDPSSIRIPRSAFRAGRNVIAVSVHNVALTSSDLTFIPVLVRVAGAPVGRQFRRGDANNDTAINLGDGLYLLNYLFQNGPVPQCIDTVDTDDNGLTNVADGLFLLNHLFLNGPVPPRPGTVCGPDGTPDALGDCSSAGCQ